MAIEVMPAKVSDMDIEQLVRECTERDPDRWRDQGDSVVVVFDGYGEELLWDRFGTCDEPAFRNHIYAGVCSSLEEIAGDSEADLTYNCIVRQNEEGRLILFAIAFRIKEQLTQSYRGHGENRAEAALRSFVSFLRATT